MITFNEYYHQPTQSKFYRTSSKPIPVRHNVETSRKVHVTETLTRQLRNYQREKILGKCVIGKYLHATSKQISLLNCTFIRVAQGKKQRNAKNELHVGNLGIYHLLRFSCKLDFATSKNNFESFFRRYFYSVSKFLPDCTMYLNTLEFFIICGIK